MAFTAVADLNDPVAVIAPENAAGDPCVFALVHKDDTSSGASYNVRTSVCDDSVGCNDPQDGVAYPANTQTRMFGYDGTAELCATDTVFAAFRIGKLRLLAWPLASR